MQAGRPVHAWFTSKRLKNPMRAAFFLFLAVLFAALPGLPAEAQGRRASGVRPLDQILPQIRRAHPGQFYDADGPIYAPDGSSH